ncbi:MAG: rhomboid family intramembrane serine protease [Verrucomicrobia bacterium]|nr:rhomboid family intramembrane serine protease [Verrucomicrobiota bacterium]
MFFILPIGVDYRARRYPVVTFTLMGVCVAVYLLSVVMALSGADAESWMLEPLWLIPSESRWWTYLTSHFVHAGFLHLAGNMIYLFLFGACVEDMMGRGRFVAFYVLCGVFADLAYIALAPGHFSSEIPMGGASGAVSGCIGGFLVLRPRTSVEFKWVFFLWVRIWNGDFTLPAWVVISGWFLMDLLGAVVTASAAQESGGVAFGAHVGGTLFGLAAMLLLKRRISSEVETDEAEAVSPRPVARPVARVRVRAAAAPVLAETPTVLLFLGGAECGPYTLTQVQRMFVAGDIPADALYWQDGMEEWRNAEELRAPGII